MAENEGPDEVHNVDDGEVKDEQANVEQVDDGEVREAFAQETVNAPATPLSNPLGVSTDTVGGAVTAYVNARGTELAAQVRPAALDSNDVLTGWTAQAGPPPVEAISELSAPDEIQDFSDHPVGQIF